MLTPSRAASIALSAAAVPKSTSVSFPGIALNDSESWRRTLPVSLMMTSIVPAAKPASVRPLSISSIRSDSSLLAGSFASPGSSSVTVTALSCPIGKICAVAVSPRRRVKLRVPPLSSNPLRAASIVAMASAGSSSIRVAVASPSKGSSISVSAALKVMRPDSSRLTRISAGSIPLSGKSAVLSAC